MSEWIATTLLIAIPALSLLCLAALIATPFLARRADGERGQLLVGLLPLEFVVLVLSLPFWCAALAVMSGV